MKYTVLFVLLFPMLSFSQIGDRNNKVDSNLESLNRDSVEDQKQSYRDLNLYLMRQGGDKTEQLYQYAFEKDSSDVGRMMLYFGWSKIVSRGGDVKRALQIKLDGLLLAEKLEDTEEIVEYNTSIANSYLFQNKPDKALYYLNVAEPLAQNKGYRQSLTNIYYNRGMLQMMLDDVEGAKFYYLKVYKNVEDRENDSRKRFAVYMVVDFFSQTNYPTELATYTEILAELYENAHPNTPMGHMPIKQIFNKRTDLTNIPLYLETFRISDSLNQINSYVLSSLSLTDIYNKMEQPKKSIALLKQVEQKIDTLDKLHWTKEVYTKLVESHIADDNYVGAYGYKLLESKLRDHITSEKVQRNIVELEIKYDTEKKTREIAEQKLIISEKSKQKNKILIGLIALGLVLILSLLFFSKRLKDQQVIAKQKETLQQNEIYELQQQNKLLALNSMIEGQESERLRIAKDLHDSLGGLLSTVKAHFTTIQNEIAQLQSLNITEKTNALIDEACIEVRRISHNMMPQALSIAGLGGAMEDLAEQLKSQGHEVTLEISNLPELDETKKITLYRLTQEICSNILKHADAKTVLIQLLGTSTDLNLIIEDDGKGFDYDKEIASEGLGLESIKSRVEFLDGTIDWDSELHKGTTINIKIPLL